MKTALFLKIRNAFQNYKENKKTVANYQFNTLSGIDYTKPRITTDKTKNPQEQAIISAIQKKSEIEVLIRVVDETMYWFELEGYGRERYIKLRLIDGESEFRSCDKIGISERTGRRWKRDIYEKAETIAERLGV